jgi:RNA polymerase sigma factor (sigma-70 family)
MESDVNGHTGGAVSDRKRETPSKHDSEARELVERYLRSGSQEEARGSLDLLCAHCYPTAQQVARCYARNEADVADLAQDAIVQLATHVGQIREPATFPRWFTTVAHNVGRQWLRRQLGTAAPCGSRVDGADDHLVTVPDPSAQIGFDWIADRELAHAYLVILPERERDVISRYYLGDLTYQQIACDLKMTPRAVEGLLYRGLRRLTAIATQLSESCQTSRTRCAVCGEHQLEGYLRLGDQPDHPLRLQATCPDCQPGYYWWHNLPLPADVYPSIDDAMAAGWSALSKTVRQLLRQPTPLCPSCMVPLVHRRRWESVDRAGNRFAFNLRWECPSCGGSIQSPATVVADAIAEWRAFTTHTSQLVLGPQRLVGRGETSRLVVDARDLLTGRRARLTIACDSLRVIGLDVGK